MVIIFLLSLVGTVTLAAQPIHIQRVMRQVETAQLGILDGVLQLLVQKFRHLAALGANLVMVRVAVVALFILGGGAELDRKSVV